MPPKPVCPIHRVIKCKRPSYVNIKDLRYAGQFCLGLYIIVFMRYQRFNCVSKIFKKANECLLKDRRKARGRFVYSTKISHH